MLIETFYKKNITQKLTNILKIKNAYYYQKNLILNLWDLNIRDYSQNKPITGI